MSKARGRTVLTFFCLYCAVMLFLLFARSEPADAFPYWEQVRSWTSLTPLRTIRRQVRWLLHSKKVYFFRHAVVNLAGNVVLFLPLGIFLPCLLPKLNRFWKVMLAAAGIIVTVEIAQVLTLLGRCDIDDLILNLAGTAIGYGIYKGTRTNP